MVFGACYGLKIAKLEKFRQSLFLASEYHTCANKDNNPILAMKLLITEGLCGSLLAVRPNQVTGHLFVRPDHVTGE